MDEGNFLERLRMPIGSLVVDASLVIALVWNAATIQESLHGIASRVDHIESSSGTVAAEARLRVLEAEQSANDREVAALKTDIGKRFDAQDAKIDAIYRAVVLGHGR